MILEDTPSAAQQETRYDDGHYAPRSRMQDKPGVKLKPNNKDEHHYDGHSALLEDAERQRTEEQADNQSNNHNSEPRRRGSLKPAQTHRERRNDCVSYRRISRLRDALVRVIVERTGTFFWIIHSVTSV